MILWIYWDPDPSIFVLPFLNWPILWYGLFFALGFIVGFPVFVSILTRYFLTLNEWKNEGVKSLREKAVFLADKLTAYVVIATIVGARLGHFLFYEKASEYLRDPWEIFRLWKGGLASHGAVVAIIISIIFFSYRIRFQFPFLNWIRILDFISVPAAFAGGCIRVGNFFNQEILGTITNVPWAVVFGHPFDQTISAPRHPVQLYEALGYFFLFILLWGCSYRPYFLKRQGKLVGIFLIFVFTFRFFIEFFKLEQSKIASAEFFLTMGQILSIPVIVLGCIFFFLPKRPYST